MRILFLSILLFSLSTAANKTVDPENSYYYRLLSPVKKGTKVSVTDFTKAYGGVFRGFSKDLDGEGFYYFRAEHLAKALGKDTRDILRKAKKITGTTVAIKNDLYTVVPPPEGHNFTVTLPDE